MKTDNCMDYDRPKIDPQDTYQILDELRATETKLHDAEALLLQYKTALLVISQLAHCDYRLAKEHARFALEGPWTGMAL